MFQSSKICSLIRASHRDVRPLRTSEEAMATAEEKGRRGWLITSGWRRQERPKGEQVVHLEEGAAVPPQVYLPFRKHWQLIFGERRRFQKRSLSAHLVLYPMEAPGLE